MTTRTRSGGVSSSARSGWGGKMLAPASRRACKKRKSLCPAALAKNACVAARQPSATGQQAGSALQSWSGCMAKLLEVAKKAASLGFSPPSDCACARRQGPSHATEARQSGATR